MLSMQSSSPTVFQTPSTPGRSSYYSARSHQPLASSPLASPKSSPVVAAQARRQAQYKTRATGSSRSATNQLPCTQSGSQTPENPQKSFLRDRFKARCLERAQKQRHDKVQKQRTASGSDVFFDSEMDCDEDEDEEFVMQDELFRRIIANAAHKKTHEYRLSYSYDVGSSFDPDMEDVNRWESELQEMPPDSYSVTPEDLEQEEIEAYAAEYANFQELSDLGASIDDFSAWSDIEDTPLPSSPMTDKPGRSSEDQDMDLS
ncbi:hypothetical protein DEU56DRAFT_798284 [Suillus clintonianus]|uniref:uncharacterized protein n=1 Tax=Suillus clintonianus TaxID=1904413 RepID=UPI001B8633E9|nr:uncharacterized protein DEU56DRAFT_798284 [Suillus clintonianus]KAG2140695.1 hypothetical protein DEU56DRAFT_798284 [Suillus clintonianus]